MLKYLVIIFAISFTSCTVDRNTDKHKKTNVIIIYTDDQNFSQIGAFGGQVLTPNMDRLAGEGVKFNNYCTNSAVCSPSRYGVLTGKNAARCQSLKKLYPTSEPAFIRWNTDIEKGEQTIAHLMKRNGYKTGMVGKYHLYINDASKPDSADDLSDEEKKWFDLHSQEECDADANPEDPTVKDKLKKNYSKFQNIIKSTAGFDYVEGLYINNLEAMGILDELLFHNQEWITSKTVDFLEENKNDPFFLYLAPTLPHGPSPIASIKANRNVTPLGYEDFKNYQPARSSVFTRVNEAGFPQESAPITWLDDAIGVLVNKLDSLGILDNTLILFASDHSNEKGKMTCYNAAIKAPAFAYWKGHFDAGMVSDEIISNVDFVPTILDVCNIKDDYFSDGLSFLPLLEGQKISPRKSMYVEVTYTRGVMTKEWKYIAVRFPEHINNKITPENRKEFNQEGTRFSTNSKSKVKVRYNVDDDYPGYFDDDQLYDLENDPNEQHNLAYDNAYHDKLEEMKNLLKSYSADLPHQFGEFGNGK